VANPGRDAAADVIDGQCLPATRKFSAWDGDNEGGIATGIALFLKISYDQSLTTKIGRERSVMMNAISDELILVARLLLATLFLIFGWRKVRDYSGTVSQMVQVGLPMPVLAAVVSIAMELPVAFAVALGIFTRPSAALMALYALGTALIGHRYWTVKGADYVDSLEGFYKDLSIMGGFLLLCITGAGKYSIDALLRMYS
jgi:putative oxidoreductase